MDCNAFGNCDGLTQIEIPKSLDVGGDYYSGAFADCANLKKVTFERGTTKIASSLFCGCTGIEKIDIPDTVTVVQDYAFKECKNLSTVNIPENVTEIGSKAFNECISLSNVNIPDSVKKKRGYAIYQYKNLDIVTL